MRRPPAHPRILAIVPARGGSKGIPKKNIAPLGGRPLLHWTLEVAKKSKLLTDVVVSTDSPPIARAAAVAGFPVPFFRPANLARNTTPTLPVLQHAIKQMEARRSYRYDYIVVLEPTSPFRIAADVDGAIRKAIRTKADSIIGVYRLEDIHPVRTKKIVRDRLVPFCLPEPEGLPRQSLPPAYYRNGAVYVIRRSVVMAGSIWGDISRPFVMPSNRSIDIDTPLSLAIAAAMIKHPRTKS